MNIQLLENKYSFSLLQFELKTYNVMNHFISNRKKFQTEIASEKNNNKFLAIYCLEASA